MATSEAGAFIRYPTANYAAGEPASTHFTRTMVNNVHHLADEDAQVLVCSSEERTVTANTAWRYAGSYGVFPMKMSGGTPYPCRIRLRMHLASATNVGIIAAVVPPGELGDVFDGAGGVSTTNPAVARATINNTAAAWISLTFNSGVTNMIYPSREMMDVGMRRFSAPKSIGGAKTADVRIVLGELAIFARKPTAGSVDTTIDAAYLAQYVGL